MKLGILGGTFDPIHVGHLEAARAAVQSLALDRLMLLPSRTPPHRSSEPRASGFHRFAMAAMAACEEDKMVASDLELQREGPSYTSVTLERLHADGCQPSQLYFVLGADAFAELSTWHNYPRLLDQCNWVVVSRPGFAIADHRSPITDRHTSVSFIEARTPDVSSTDIRRRVAAGESIEGLVCRSVLAHIQRHQLYMPNAVAAHQ